VPAHPSFAALRRAFAIAAALAVTQPSTAIAQPELDASNRASARRLSEEALEHYRAGRWQEALDGFDAARKLLSVPTLATFSARCLVRLGRLVEASERYRLAASLAIDPSLTPEQQEGQRVAQAEAERERAELLPRIPTLVVDTDRAPGPGDEVRLDGAPIPRIQLGVARLVDPGPHRVTLVRDGHEIGVTVIELSEGAQERASLTVAPPSPPPPPLLGESRAAPHEAHPSPVEIAGWTAVAVGGTSLVVSGITFGSAASINSSLEDDCAGGTCAKPLADRVDTYDALRITSIATLAGGLVIGAAGVTMLVLAPDEPSSARAQVRVSARTAELSMPF
jgi:hypothetical protein